MTQIQPAEILWENAIERAETIGNNAGQMQTRVCFGVWEPQQNMGVSEYLYMGVQWFSSLSLGTSLYICVLFKF